MITEDIMVQTEEELLLHHRQIPHFCARLRKAFLGRLFSDVCIPNIQHSFVVTPEFPANMATTPLFIKNIYRNILH